MRCNSLLLIALLALGGCSAKAPVPPAPPADAPGEAAVAPGAAAPQRAAFDAAVALMREGHHEAARGALEELLEQAPDSPGVHLNLALLHRQREAYEKALTHVDRALALDPDNASGHNLRGSLLRQQGEFLGAARAYEQALSLKPDYSAAHLNLAILCDIYLKEWPRARSHYQRYLALAEEPDPRVTFWLQDLEMRIAGAGS